MDNRRKHPRFIVEGVQGKMTFTSQVEVLNMSVTGAALRLDRRLKVGGEYTLRFKVRDKIVPVKAIIVWSQLSEITKGGGGEDIPFYTAGVKFDEVLSQKVVEIIEFIDEHKLVNEQRLGGVRFRIDAPGKVALDLPQAYRVKAMSLSGMLIESERMLGVDGRYPMELILEEGTPICFLGRVASCLEISTQDPSLFDIGIAFVQMDLEDKARLVRFIETL